MICDHCGQDKEDVGVQADPYIETIFGEYDESAWCDDCYCNRADDI